MRFTSLIRLPSHLILLPLLTLASPTTSSSNTTTSWCLSTTTGTGPLYLFNPTKSCTDQIVTFTPEIMQATDICHSTFQKYQFKMCGKNVTLSVNFGPKSVFGAKQMGYMQASMAPLLNKAQMAWIDLCCTANVVWACNGTIETGSANGGHPRPSHRDSAGNVPEPRYGRPQKPPSLGQSAARMCDRSSLHTRGGSTHGRKWEEMSEYQI
ncbi:hypothetical protein HII31_03549, partial [Pseudocercospora fuligena]